MAQKQILFLWYHMDIIYHVAKVSLFPILLIVRMARIIEMNFSILV